MNVRSKLLTASIFLFFSNYIFSQSDCECEDLQITICYLRAGDYCSLKSGSSACGYALDGRHMNDYLRPKLINPDNFGPDGIVNCPIDLVPLIRANNITVDYIEELQCDIIFTGNFIYDTLTYQVNTEVTSVPQITLERIKEWSVKCESNLVVTTQAEADIWGYSIQDLNQNPNVSVGNDLGDFIFNGPFGQVNNFNQGGSYQGIITGAPETGFTRLGVDANGRSTFVIDTETNDLILGDIGIFCGGNVGSISLGSQIQNENDRLTANIFALICDLAGAATGTIEQILCEGEQHISPTGEVFTSNAVYIDSLLTENNCDSILTTTVTFVSHETTNLTYDGCQGDGFTFAVNGNIYDESNPTGEVLLQTVNGCDSIVTIAFEYKENFETTYEDEICPNDLQGIIIGNNVFNALNPQGEAVLTASNGCDSIVNVFLEVFPDNIQTNDYLICEGSALELHGNTYDAPQQDVLIFPAANGCDSIIVVNVDQYPEIPNVNLGNPLEVKLNEDYYVMLNFSDQYSIEWSPKEIVSCTDCFDFFIQPDLAHDILFYTIEDSFGCTASDSIQISYDCPVYIPNVFSPDSDNIDNQSFFIGTPCKSFMTTYEMNVFDRWGNLIFQSDDPNAAWDGSLRSQKASIGVYVYVLKYSSFGKEKIIAGDVTLLR